MNEIVMAAMFLIVIVAIIVVYERKLQRAMEQHEQERKDLLDRIMSRSFVEYKEQTTETVKSGPVIVTDEEEWAREIEQMKTG